MSKTIGILGGMGPQASCELYRLINEKSSSRKNADFPHLLINSLPVKDLIKNADEKEKTIQLVAEGAMALEKAGATDIFMACNTMHAFQDQLTKGLTHARFHSLIELVANKAKNAKKVLFVGSHTTIQTQLYQRALTARHIPYDVPDDVLLSHSVEMILDTIGKNMTDKKIEDYVNHVLHAAKHDPDIDTILLGCTELPLFFPQEMEGYRVISSLHTAAEKIVSLAGREEREEMKEENESKKAFRI